LEELVQQQQQPPPPLLLLLNNMVPSYNAIRHACRKRGINMDMRFCRKIHGSWLHQHGLTAEEIDFFQGRSSISVFSRHYLTPKSSFKDRVIAALEKLKQEIEQ
jgi:intergrase/recombinase